MKPPLMMILVGVGCLVAITYYGGTGALLWGIALAFVNIVAGALIATNGDNPDTED